MRSTDDNFPTSTSMCWDEYGGSLPLHRLRSYITPRVHRRAAIHHPQYLRAIKRNHHCETVEAPPLNSLWCHQAPKLPLLAERLGRSWHAGN